MNSNPYASQPSFEHDWNSPGFRPVVTIAILQQNCSIFLIADINIIQSLKRDSKKFGGESGQIRSYFINTNMFTGPFLEAGGSTKINHLTSSCMEYLGKDNLGVIKANISLSKNARAKKPEPSGQSLKA